MATSDSRRGAAAAPPRRLRPYPATVVEIDHVGAHLKRVTLGGAGLKPFRWPGPASHLKLSLPEPGCRDVVLPPADDEGFMVVEPGRSRPMNRTFTPRRWDRTTGRLDLEFVLHGHGPASRWAASAQPGDQVAVSQPRRTYELRPDTRWLLLAGDESALPALATLLEVISADVAVELLIEIEDRGHQVTLPGPKDVSTCWLPRDSGDRPGAALVSAINGWKPPPGQGQVWAGCEAVAVRDIRSRLLGPLAFPKERLLTRGYWRFGQANHPDHDYGEDAA